MPMILPIQNSFASGSISKLMYSRSDLKDTYGAAVTELENFVPLPQGPIVKRDGTKFLGEVPGNFARIFGYPVNTNTGFYVVISDLGKMYIFTPFGPDSAAPNQVVNGGFAGGAASWLTGTNKQAIVIFNVGSCELRVATKTNTYAYIEQQVTITNPADIQNIALRSRTNTSLGALTITVGTAQGGSDLYNNTITGYDENATFDPAGNSTVWLRVQLTTDQTVVQSRLIYAIYIADQSLQTPIEFAVPWDKTDQDALHVGMPPGDPTMYFVTPRKAPYKLTYDVVTEAFTFGAVTYTGAPTQWGPNNYPSTIAFFEGRKWLGGTPNEPEVFWGSKSGSYEDFTSGTQADDGLSFTMDKRGGIKFMHGLRNLVIGTEFGEFIVTSETPPIKPGDIHLEQQSAYGSLNIQPQSLGNKLVYVTPDGKKLRDLGFQWTDEGYVSNDITFIASHIIENNVFRDVVFKQYPQRVLIATTSAFNLSICAYEESLGIIGWTKCKTNADPENNLGSISAVAVLPLGGEDFCAWCVVRKLDKIYVELNAPTYNLDSAVEKSFETPTDVMTGLDHLEGMTVGVLVDEAVHPDVVVTGGQITLQYKGNLIEAGLNVMAICRTLPLTIISEVENIDALMKRYNKIYVRIVDSAKPKINGLRPPTRHPATLMNTREPVRTEDMEVANLGWDLQALIEITQELPIDTTITGIFGEVSVENM